MEVKAVDKSEVLLLSDGHCFRNQIVQLCKIKKRGVGGGVHFESGSLFTLIQLVNQQYGVTFIPHLAVMHLSPQERKTRVKPIKGKCPVRTVSMIRHRTVLKASIAEALQQTIRKQIPPEVLRVLGKSDYELNPIYE